MFLPYVALRCRWGQPEGAERDRRLWFDQFGGDDTGMAYTLVAPSEVSAA